jgi:ubiquinone biosynthesis protein
MLKTCRQFFRLIQINWILAKQGLDRAIFPKNHISYYLTYLNPWNWSRQKNRQPEEIRVALEKLGPIFVKFGQILSTRRDLVPEAIVAELSKLQDRVPPFPFSQVRKSLEQTYEKPLDEVFDLLEPDPLASASIAQVHAARLKTGESVVVKVLRPDIHKIIDHDVVLLEIIARLVQAFLPKNSGLHLPSLVAEFKRALLNELDLVKEGANASEVRRNFADFKALYVPKIYWTYTDETVLVMERIHGIPIHDIPALKAAQMPLKKVAEIGIELFFAQVFRDCFFHADMHPGNIFVRQMPEIGLQYVLVDFGIVGTLDEKDQYYLAENLMAFLNRDYRRVALLHVESGWLSEEADAREFESGIRAACEPIFERPLKEVSLAQVLIRLFQTAKQFNIEIQPQLLLLQKTLFNLEGIVRDLDPEIDFWGTSRPFLERWMREKHHPLALLKKMKNRFPYWLESFITSTDAKRIRAMMLQTMFPPKELRVKTKQSKTKSYFFLGLSLGCLVSLTSIFLWGYYL